MKKPADIPKAKRKRLHYPHQEHGLKGKEGKQFMLEMGETLKTGPWTTFKFLLVASVLKEAEDTSIDTDYAIILMDTVKTVAKALGLNLSLPQRSQEDLQKLQRHCSHKSKEMDTILHLTHV